MRFEVSALSFQVSRFTSTDEALLPRVNARPSQRIVSSFAAVCPSQGRIPESLHVTYMAEHIFLFATNRHSALSPSGVSLTANSRNICGMSDCEILFFSWLRQSFGY